MRICRAWIISEEWLATGEYGIARKIAVEQFKVPKDTDFQSLEELFFRQCMDLGAETVSRSIPPGTKFAEAFRDYLAPTYRELFKIYHHLPRIKWMPNEWELGERLLSALNHRWLLMVRFTAKKHGVTPDTASASLLGLLIRMNLVAARKFIGVPTSADRNLIDDLKAFLDGPSPPPMSDQAIAAWAERKVPTVQPSPAPMTIRQAVAKPVSAQV